MTEFRILTACGAILIGNTIDEVLESLRLHYFIHKQNSYDNYDSCEKCGTQKMANAISKIVQKNVKIYEFFD